MKNHLLFTVLTVLLTVSFTEGSLVFAATGDDDSSLTQKKADELQRQIDVLGQEIQKMKIGAASEPVADTEVYGFGPGASKVYKTQQGISIGGYGEILDENFRNGFNSPGKTVDPGNQDFNANNGQSQFDIARAVLYVGYKFNDAWVLNSEIEFERAGKETEVEFLYLDHFYKPWLNFRVGNLLNPMGLTNETHEPTTYLSTHRPTLETLVIPTTWSQYGFGFFGDAGPITYRTYAVTGLNASGFNDEQGLEGGRYESDFANGSRWAWVARVDYTAVPGLLAGGSAYIGEASTVPVSGFDLASVPIKIFEVHAQYNWKAWDFRAMGAYSTLSNVDVVDAENAVALNNSIGSRQGGFYLQTGYDFLTNSTQSFMPFVRWETVDTQISVPNGYTLNGADLIHEIDAGIAYKPIPQLVFKADYQWFLMGDNSGVDQWNVAMGYVF
jgi:hypothetical protein